MRSRASSECRLHSTSMTWAFSNPVKRTGTARWLHEAAQQATRTIPIVADFQDDPVATGLISGLAGPGAKERVAHPQCANRSCATSPTHSTGQPLFIPASPWPELQFGADVVARPRDVIPAQEAMQE